MATAPGTAPATAVPRDELVAYLDDLLQAQVGQDYCPNGLQVAGTETVGRLVTGVSACHELFVRARDLGADAVLVHHGIFWYGAPLSLVGVQGRRVKELYAGDLNLLAYHLPLDRDATFGNNVLAAKAFGLEELETFAAYKGHDIGFRGRFPEPIDGDELVRRAGEIFGQEPLAFRHGPERIRTLGIVSGGAQKELYTAIDAGLDAFITGEASEWVMNIAREAGIHYLAAGHYATERLGVRSLGEHLAERFGIAVDFVDVPNPV
jgi:dinuclear metal center YbgI/SA1388 family protein